MKEDIKIRCDYCKFVEDCVDYGWDGCRKFTPAPSKPITNEEWLRTATTEQLAEEIYECVMTHPWHISKEVILEWLKQPHRGDGE